MDTCVTTNAPERFTPNRASLGRGEQEIIAESRKLKEVLSQAEMVAATNCTVIIQGDTGTGKELIAGFIHNHSPRRQQALIKLNCAAIPLGLLESELFGHERGAFTGAMAQRLGRFELADKGSLFLDEVGDIPMELQPKLLRVLQEQEFERLGGHSHNPNQCAANCSHPSQSRSNGRRRNIPAGSLLQAERLSYHRSGAARPARGHSSSGLALHQQVRTAIQPANRNHSSRRDGKHGELLVARQHPGTAELH